MKGGTPVPPFFLCGSTANGCGMPQIRLMPDTLDADTERFAPDPLGAPLFLNSLPKSGSHLLRNILRMFRSISNTEPSSYSGPTCSNISPRSNLPGS
jgi:hypothetical protein